MNSSCSTVLGNLVCMCVCACVCVYVCVCGLLNTEVMSCPATQNLFNVHILIPPNSPAGLTDVRRIRKVFAHIRTYTVNTCNVAPGVPRPAITEHLSVCYQHGLDITHPFKHSRHVREAATPPHGLSL